MLKNFALAHKIILLFLVILVATNIFFFMQIHLSGPLFGIIVYSYVIIILFVNIRRGLRVALMASVLGFGIHLYELIRMGGGPFAILFYLNLILPAIIIVFSLISLKR